MAVSRNEDSSNTIMMPDTCLNGSGYILLAMEGREEYFIYKVGSSHQEYRVL